MQSLNTGSDTIAVVIIFMDNIHVLQVNRHFTLGVLREKWCDELGSEPSVDFFSVSEQYLTDDMTVDTIIHNTGGRVLELKAILRTMFWIQLFGFEDSQKQFEVAPMLTPAAVKNEMAKTLGVFMDTFRLTTNDAVLDLEVPFGEQNVSECELLTVDLKLTVNLRGEDGDVTTIECFGSDHISDFRQMLGLTDDQVLVTTTPYRRLLPKELRLCHVVSDPILPIELVTEHKVFFAFEPIGLEHLRQQLKVPLSATPVDLYDVIAVRFDLSCEFRLSINGKSLNPCIPLGDQLFDWDDVIQIDLLRRFLVHDLWDGEWNFANDQEILLYSTESAFAICGKDVLTNERLLYENVQLTIFGSVVDVFGTISGQYNPILFVDRDVQRKLHFLSFNEIQQRLGWSHDHFFKVAPTDTSHNLKETMYYNQPVPQKYKLENLRLSDEALFTTDPLKIIIQNHKKLLIHRAAHGTTLADVRAKMQQRFSANLQLRPRHRSMEDDAINRRMELDLFLLEQESRFRTRLIVTVSGKGFACWFEAEEVSFTEVMINIGRQAKVMPRHLFRRHLYCCGCGRQVSKEEEEFQAIPSRCCRVRSLQLTDRQRKDVGTQSATRRRDASTSCLDPEQRDVCVGTVTQKMRAIVQASCENEDHYRAFRRKVRTPQTMLTSFPAKLFSDDTAAVTITATTDHKTFRITEITPSGGFEESTISVAAEKKCRDLLELERIGDPDSVVMYAQELFYMRQRERRRAVQCFDESSRNLLLVDFRDGNVPRNSSWLYFARRFFQLEDSLPVAPRLMPRVFILTDTDVVTVDERGELRSDEPKALINTAYVMSMTGIRSGTKLFWELVGDSFADASSGVVYWRRGWIPKGEEKRHVLALLKGGDRVPKAAVPRNKVLRVFRRSGMQLSIEDGCVKAAPVPVSDKQLWDSPIKIEAFDKEFTLAASKR